jgi:acetoacetate decarboxylase
MEVSKMHEDAIRTRAFAMPLTNPAGPVRVATATMGYKHKTADLASIKASLAEPNFLLKIIPHVDGTPRICELVEFYLKDVDLKGAWTGPSSLNLWSHARSDRATWRGLGERTGASRGGTRLRTRAPVLAARLH